MIIVPKTSGDGIQVDPAAPTFGYRDIIGMPLFNTTGANAPAIAAKRGGNCRALKFILNDQMDYVYHLPHDWVPGSDLFVHVHWLHNGTAITGNASFQLSYTLAKGFGQAIFPAEKQQTITFATTNIATTPQWSHRTDEIQLSNSGGTGNYIDTSAIEVDALVNVNVKLSSLPTITGGDLFVDTVDIHYQSNNMATKAKAPNFYT